MLMAPLEFIVLVIFKTLLGFFLKGHNKPTIYKIQTIQFKNIKIHMKQPDIKL